MYLRGLFLFFFYLAAVSIIGAKPTEATIIVQLVNGTQTNITSVEIIYVGTNKEFMSEPISMGISTDPSKVSDRIFLINNPLAIDEIIVQVQQLGARAVISISPVYFVAGYLKYRVNDRQAIHDIRIPVVEVPLLDGQRLWSLAQENQIVNVTILPGDGNNAWEEAFTNPAFYLWTTNIALCCWKMSLFVRHYGGFRTSISLIVLSVELISNLIRIISCIDPLGSWGIYTEQTYAALLELSWPISIVTYTLFTLYWHEMMTTASLVVHPFMVKLKIPAFIISGVLVGLQITRTILRNVTIVNNFITITSIIYLIVWTTLLTFYLVTGIKILVRMNNSKHMGRTVNLRKTTIKILTAGVFILGFVIVVILFVGKIPYKTPTNFIVIFYVLPLLQNSLSLTAIMAFELPSKSSSGSSGKKSLKSGKNSDNPSRVDSSDTPK